MTLEKTLEKMLLHEARMEALLAELLDGKLVDAASLVIRPQSSFKRGYNRDIMGYEWMPVKKGTRETAILNIDVSREGLYDTLPEFFFHEPQRTAVYSTIEQRTKDSEQVKQEEIEARKFFLPFEQEFFRKKIEIEQEERKLVSGISNPLQQEVFEKFWTDIEGIKPQPKAILFHLLPLVHRIAGDMALMQLCFEAVLQEEVELRRKMPPRNYFGEDASPQLGEAGLGADFIIGDSVDNELPELEVIIGPVAMASMPLFLEGGQKQKLLSVLYDYFVPFELDVTTRVELEQESLARQKWELETRIGTAPAVAKTELEQQKSVLEERLNIARTRAGFMISSEPETGLLGLSTLL